MSNAPPPWPLRGFRTRRTHWRAFAAMTEPARVPQLAHLDDAELARLAAIWRTQALRGDREANGIAHLMEVERRRRLRHSQMQPLAPTVAPRRPWWAFWRSPRADGAERPVPDR